MKFLCRRPSVQAHGDRDREAPEFTCRPGAGNVDGYFRVAPTQPMKYSQKVVLHCPVGYRMGLDALVEQFVADGVKFVGVVGEDCDQVEDIIDELVVGDGTAPTRFILTSSHPSESIEDVVEFARYVSSAGDGVAQVVTIGA